MRVLISLILLSMQGSAQFLTVQQWEKRMIELRSCIQSQLPVPLFEGTLIPTPKRVYNGYTVENIAIETIRGLFVCVSIYKPLNIVSKVPAVLVPNGHFEGGRYRADVQSICATLARLGAIAVSYDLFGWGESRLQVKEENHYTSVAMRVQRINSRKILDYISSLPETDTARIGMTGASGGGSQTMLTTAIDERIKVSVPVVMLSADFPGGCPCETGIPIHSCIGGTNNAEIAAMAAPRPQLVISCGKDWTKNVPVKEYPYLQKIYALFNKLDAIENVHLEKEGHDFGINKRTAMYRFMAEHLQLEIAAIQDNEGNIDECAVTIEDEKLLHVFSDKQKLPAHALKDLQSVVLALDR